MLTSTRRSLSCPNNVTRADSADVPRDFKTVVDALELDVVFSQGTLAARPAAGAGAPAATGGGRLYWATDTQTLYYDTGAAWVQINANATIADGSVTLAKLAANSVDASKIVDLSVGTAELAAGAVTAAKIAAALFPSQGAANGTEALRAIGTGAGQVAAGNDSRFRTEVIGRVAANGSIQAGTGFTVVANGSGSYDVTFNVAFASVPVLMVQQLNGAATWSAPTVNGFHVQTQGAANQDFNFRATLPF
jgi:hypothetical protein